MGGGEGNQLCANGVVTESAGQRESIRMDGRTSSQHGGAGRESPHSGMPSTVVSWGKGIGWGHPGRGHEARPLRHFPECPTRMALCWFFFHSMCVWLFHAAQIRDGVRFVRGDVQAAAPDETFDLILARCPPPPPSPPPLADPIGGRQVLRVPLPARRRGVGHPPADGSPLPAPGRLPRHRGPGARPHFSLLPPVFVLPTNVNCTDSQ